MKRIIATVISVILMAVTLSGCMSGCAGGSSDEISVFYYTFSDTYISSVRSAMDKIFRENNVKFNSYDANSNQSTQTEQVDIALSKGASLLVVNIVDTGSNDAAQNIVNKARERNVPVIFFNRSVDEAVVKSYDKCVFVGTDYEMAGHMQGEMVGNFLLKNYDAVDLNKDGKISYVMFKGQEGNMEAIARTQYGVEDANKVLAAAGKPKMQFYDKQNKNGYLVDQDGNWSSASATNYMGTILAQFSESNNNMVELVIANNDEMALGAVSALQAAGYNKQGGKTIPVFGVDATDAAKTAIKDGRMMGTIKQDGEGMAKVIHTLCQNFKGGKPIFEGVSEDTVLGNWRVNIPYSAYTGEE